MHQMNTAAMAAGSLPLASAVRSALDDALAAMDTAVRVLCGTAADAGWTSGGLQALRTRLDALADDAGHDRARIVAQREATA